MYGFLARNPGPLVVRSSYEPEAADLFARMTTPPTATRKGHINTLVKAMKDAGVWSKLHALYLLAAADSQAALLNWKSTSFNLTPANSPTFTADRGYTGGGTAYLDTGFSPSAHGSQNSFSLGLWSRNNTASAAPAMGSGATTTTQLAMIFPRYTDDTAYLYCNEENSVTPVVATTDGSGWTAINRSSSGATQARKNGSQSGSFSTSSSTPNSTSVRLLAAGNYPGATWSGEMAAATIGQSLTSSEHASLYSAIQTYLVAVGAA